jgi:hypothetical protein
MVVISIVHQLWRHGDFLPHHVSKCQHISIQLKLLLHDLEVCILMSLSSATMVQQIVASFVSLKCFAWQAILQCEMKVANSWNVV